MTGKRDKDSARPRGRGISREEQRLWDFATQDVTPVKTRPGADPSEPPASMDAPYADAPPARTGSRGIAATRTARPAMPDQPPELDHRTHSRLRKGRIPIEAVLDLHGLTQPDAHAALSRFIQDAYAAQKRCVLVITGKGGDRIRAAFTSDFTGVLRQRLPEWLGQMPLAPLVLKTETARQQHGGDGAFYVYLKRRRPD